MTPYRIIIRVLSSPSYANVQHSEFAFSSSDVKCYNICKAHDSLKNLTNKTGNVLNFIFDNRSVNNTIIKLTALRWDD